MPVCPQPLARLQYFSGISDPDIVGFLCREGDRQDFWVYRRPATASECPDLYTPSARRAIGYAQELAALQELQLRHGLDYVVHPSGTPSTVGEFFGNLSRNSGLHQIWSVPPAFLSSLSLPWSILLLITMVMHYLIDLSRSNVSKTFSRNQESTRQNNC